jgi:inorganic pyrophosphatase
MTGREPLHSLLGLVHLAHPWHGVDPGEEAPDQVTVYVEMVPSDTVKYEIDKTSGLLRLDRPQKFSSVCPAPYGFVPRTLCGAAVAGLAAARTGRSGVIGDGDPIDVCVLTDRSISHGGILVSARPVGGFRMFDGEEADDKLVAVLEADAAFGHIQDLAEVPGALVDRLRHYFLSYKDMPGAGARKVEITDAYDAREAREVLAAALEDYRALFGHLPDLVAEALRPDGRGGQG